MEETVWSYVDEPALGPYGAWEAANPDCVAMGLTTTRNTKLLLLLFASICACQVLFMASRAPRITWEAVYLPLIETVLYGMGATGNGQIRLADGRVLPISRFCSWLITCPIMLFQVVGIHDLKIWGISCKHMVMAAALIRTVFGIGASVTLDTQMRWVQFFLAYGFFLFELFCSYSIFNAGLKKFGEVKTTLNNVVYSRLLLLRFLFFFSWNSFGIIWMLSSTGLCMISEDASVLSYLVADLICKNMYGIINANTLFRVLDGKWVPETLEDAANGSKSNPNHVGETYLERLMAGVRGTKQRDRDSVQALEDVVPPADLKLQVGPSGPEYDGQPHPLPRDHSDAYPNKYMDPPHKIVPREGRGERPFIQFSTRRGDGRDEPEYREREMRRPMTPERDAYRDDYYRDYRDRDPRDRDRDRGYYDDRDRYYRDRGYDDRGRRPSAEHVPTERRQSESRVRGSDGMPSRNDLEAPDLPRRPSYDDSNEQKPAAPGGLASWFGRRPSRSG